MAEVAQHLEIGFQIFASVADFDNVVAFNRFAVARNKVAFYNETWAKVHLFL